MAPISALAILPMLSAASTVGTNNMLSAVTFMQQDISAFVDSNRLPGLRDAADVAIGPSKVCSGRGLFANDALPRWHVAALYPVHGIGVDTPSGEVDLLASVGDMDFFEGIERSEYRVNLPHDGCTHLCVDCNPTKPVVGGWEASFVNDACVCESEQPEDVERYLAQSVAGANCALVPIGPAPLMACVTTRRVEAGEELYASYGPSYWTAGAASAEKRSSEETDSKEQYYGAGRAGRRAYWASRSEQAAVLLDAADAAVLAAARGVRSEHAAELAALNEGFEAALECVTELQLQRAREAQEDEAGGG